MLRAETVHDWRDYLAPFLRGGRRAALGALAGLVLLAGWSLDNSYERSVEELRESLWRLRAELAAGAVTEQSLPDLTAEIGFQRAKTAAQLKPWDYGRPSWKYLSRAADAYVGLPTLLARGQSSEVRRQIADARTLVNRADRSLATWWWMDMTPPPWKTR